MPTRKPTIAHLRSKGYDWMRQRFRAVAQRLVQTSERSPIAVGGIALAITTGLILGLDFFFEPSFKDILVEAHGLIFDLLLFGIIILAVDLWREKRERVTRHQEELDDYRGWHEPEASYRIAGLIKRLLRDGTKVTDLAGVYLVEADLRTLNLWGIDLSKANLASVNFADSTLGDVKWPLVV